MKILKKGHAPFERKYRVTCDNCSTFFEFAQSEATLISDNRDGYYLNVICLECGDSFNVDASLYVRSTSQKANYR